MADSVYEDDQSPGDLGGIEPEDFGRRLRRFAIDAHRVLGCPDGPIDDMVELHRRAWFLLREAPGVPSSRLHGWLVAAREAIDARLRAWALEELESVVA